MFIFTSFIAPLWYLLIISFYKPPSRGWRGILIPWFGGLFIGILALTVTLSYYMRTTFSIEPYRLYRWIWIRQTGWPLTFGCILITAIHIMRPVQNSHIRELAGWFSGISTIYMAWKTLIPDNGFEDYHLFFTAFLWIMATGITVFLVDMGLRLSGWRRYVFCFSAIASPSLTSLIPIIYIIGNRIASWIIVFILLISAHIAILINSRGSQGH